MRMRATLLPVLVLYRCCAGIDEGVVAADGAVLVLLATWPALLLLSRFDAVRGLRARGLVLR